MSLDPHNRSFSPLSSGRSSPAPHVLRKTTEDGLYKKDKSFRRYASGIDRALSLFDTPQQEWADYISFLGRLLKAIQAHPDEVPVIPSSSTVATRLAQCLNPALPSGVHQKALEVYSSVFSIIGKAGLGRDLHLYFPGLSTVLSFASLTVRPLFLSLIETHVLNLPTTALRPATKAIILALLPGLEDETSEDFERMVSALDKLQKSIRSEQGHDLGTKNEAPDSYFWQCFFLAVVTNSSRRQGALSYLVRRLPSLSSKTGKGSADTVLGDDPFVTAQSIITPEPGLLIRCFASGLADSQLLIQRGFLDLLVSHIPLDSTVLQNKVTESDLDRLISAAAGVVIRRDMSLNRRLWAWFLGPESSTGHEEGEHGDQGSSHQALFFSRFGLKPLTRSMLRLIRGNSVLPAERARPFRVCLSLMDRWEVGGLIVPEIFVPALEYVERYSHTATKEQLDEVVRSASLFFDGVESSLIFGKLLELAMSALTNDALPNHEKLRQLKLIKFVLSRFNVKEDEMLLDHMPLVSLAIVAVLQAQRKNNSIEDEVLHLALNITETLISTIPDRAFTTTEPQKITQATVPTDDVLRSISKFYSDSNSSQEVINTPFSPQKLSVLLTYHVAALFCSLLSDNGKVAFAETTSRILSNMLFKVPSFEGLQELDIVRSFSDALVNRHNPQDIPSFQIAVSITTVLAPLQSAQQSNPYIDSSVIPHIVKSMVELLWEYLSPSKPKYHVEAVRCLLQLHAITASNRLIEASVTALLNSAESTPDADERVNSVEAGGRLAVLWTHTIHEQSLQTEKGARPVSRRHSLLTADLTSSEGGYEALLTRPLFHMLDALSQDGSELFTFVKAWLQDLPTLNRVFHILITHLRSLKVLLPKRATLDAAVSRSQEASLAADDAAEGVYFLRHVLNILRWASDYTWITLAEEAVFPLEDTQPNSERNVPLQLLLAQICLRAINYQNTAKTTNSQDELTHTNELHRTAVSLLQQILNSPYADPLRELDLEIPLMERLKTATPSLQSILLETIIAALKLSFSKSTQRAPAPVDRRKSTKELISALSRNSISKDDGDDEPPPTPAVAPHQLVDCLRIGFSTPSNRIILDEWVKFLAEVLPMFADTIFQNLLPLVEIFCGQIQTIFGQLCMTFKDPYKSEMVSPESRLISLMNGLEQILAKAHDRLVMKETRAAPAKPAEQTSQGFFGNVASVFTSEMTQATTRSATANSRLTVLLCFQDTVRICFSIWSWGSYGDERSDPTSQASSGYSAARLRNRARRILEHLFAAEALECLETLAVLWCEESSKEAPNSRAVLGLLNVLNGSKPKHTIPAIFDAVYSRSNPNALDPSRMSTKTSELNETDLVVFLVEYTRSLEDDAMDEIWPDCIIFLRDVLTNPMPHRQILPNLLDFICTIAVKVDNTNFGEQRKMRRELGDLFTRFLTATFTTRSMGFLQDVSQTSPAEKSNGRSSDIITILGSIVPHLQAILGDNDRIFNATTSISTNVIGPTFRAKSFPENVSKQFLVLLYQMTRVAQTSKNWKKDVSDSFNDARFFQFPATVGKESWLPILNQWTLNEKERVPELLSRLSAPTTAGIMLGIGASSARLEADRRTQLTLRRIALLLIAAPEDAFVPVLPSVVEKLTELMTATTTSSPSSITRAEVFMVLRALILKTSSVPLASLWPVVNAELSSAISAVLSDDENSDKYNNASILQACKFLDTLITISPEDWQLSEWLFVTDTIDAVYRPEDWTPVALSDAVAEGLVDSGPISTIGPSNDHATDYTFRRPLLDAIVQNATGQASFSSLIDLPRADLISKVLQPFFGQLSLWAFEGWYNTTPVGKGDWQRCVDDLIDDIFGSGIVSE